MSHNIFLILIIIYLISLIKSEKSTLDEEELDDDYVYDNYDGEQYFKEIVKQTKKQIKKK